MQYTLDHERGAYYPAIGQRCTILCPHSEVCMHMRVAGKLMKATLLMSDRGYISAQLYTLEGQIFSSPITTGEAGFYYDSKRGEYYTYYPKEIVDAEAT